MAKGRPRQFEVDEALDKALQVFWQKGYRGTSLDDLTEAMEINRPSLYAAFTDKEQLFLSSIDRYRSRFLVDPMRKFMEAKNLKSGLSEYMRMMGDVIINDVTPRGCMIACLLSEDCLDSEVIKAKLSECIELADSSFIKIFEKHREQLVPGIDPTGAAKLLTSFLYGISIRARAGATRRELAKIALSFVSSVCA